MNKENGLLIIELQFKLKMKLYDEVLEKIWDLRRKMTYLEISEKLWIWNSRLSRIVTWEDVKFIEWLQNKSLAKILTDLNLLINE